MWLENSGKRGCRFDATGDANRKQFAQRSLEKRSLSEQFNINVKWDVSREGCGLKLLLAGMGRQNLI